MAENTILSIKKALNVIDVLYFDDIGSKGLSLSELSQRLGQRTTTMHNILKTMISCGYVSKTESGLYAAGRRLKDIGEINKLTPGSTSYLRIVDIMTRLSQNLNEFLAFTALINGARYQLIRIEEKESIVRINGSLSVNENIYESATGRVLAAHSKDPVRDSPGNFWKEANTEHELKRQLEKIKCDGHCKMLIFDGQAVGIAVPVMIEPISSLGCYAPLYRCDDKRVDEIIIMLKDTAKQIEDDIIANK